jgi:hypothetical protein
MKWVEKVNDNLPTKTLGYRLEEIVKSLHANLGK